MQKRRFSEDRPILNTLINITVLSNLGTVPTKDILSDAFAKFEYVAKKFSRFDKKSELSILNDNSNGKPVKVSAELYNLVDFALQICKKTNGAFDPTVIDYLEMYGYKSKSDFSKIYEENFFKQIKEYSKHRPSPFLIKLNPRLSEIQLLQGQRIDLGSIGKGYAIDLAYNFLSKNLESFIINAGGDIRAKGVKENGSPWIISLAKEPFPNSGMENRDQNEWGKVELLNQALAASGRSERKSGVFHHLIDPRTGFPVNHTHQTFVIADTALEADAWATALFILGSPGLKIIPDKNSIKALLVDTMGNTLYNSTFLR